MKGGEKLQLGLINSWRKMELTSVQGIPTDKIDGQFTQIINALKKKPQSDELDQKSAQNEGLNQLLTILSNGIDEKYQSNQTELPALLKDLKLLERKVNKESEVSVDEKITGIIQDLHHLIFSIQEEVKTASNGTDEDYLLQMTREQKNNLLSQQNSSSEPVLQETEVVMKEAVIQGSEDNGDITKRYSTIDTKLLAIQNRVLQESRNIVGKETNTTNSKMDASQTIVTEATSELKAIISSILTKLDKQLEQKNTPVVQKMINPIMVSSLRKVGESLMPSVEIKATTVKGNENDIDSNVLPTVQNTFIKQHPFTLLTSSGEMAQPKNVEEQFAKLLANSTITKVGDMQKLAIRLAPDHLGSIRIEITQNEGNMIARIITTTAEAKETLEKQLTSLKHGFAAQNLQVDKLDIVVSSQPQEKLQKEQQQQQEQQQSQSQRNKKDADEDENKRKTSFFEELLNMEV